MPETLFQAFFVYCNSPQQEPVYRAIKYPISVLVEVIIPPAEYYHRDTGPIGLTLGL